MTVTLYENTSQNSVVTKELTEIASVSADMPISFDVSAPSFIVNGKHPACNYVYIPYTGRYYYAKATLLSNNTTKLDCKTDVLMTAKNNIYGTNQYVSRCESAENTNIIDTQIPLKNEYKTYCSRGTAVPSANNTILIGVIN